MYVDQRAIYCLLLEDGVLRTVIYQWGVVIDDTIIVVADGNKTATIHGLAIQIDRSETVRTYL